VTLADYTELHRHWRRRPRPEWLIAGYLKYKPPPEIRVRGTPRPKPKVTGGLAAWAKVMGVEPGRPVVM
jgi:hypothetical protein